ncbi:MAG TPA: hypothetical protein VHD85_07125 [Terracidiphilus sp.]|nr:hypothetical protein [Terracidiphilus sp.]
MWKSVLLVAVSAPVSVVLGIAVWVGAGWKAGLITCCCAFAAGLVVATVMAFFTRRLTLFDVFLPVIFSALWSLVLIPFSLGEDVFTAPSAIGAGLLLTLCLWKVYHEDGQSRRWLIFPILVYIYEMLPINLPGPFDDYFALTGDVAFYILYQLAGSHRRQLPGSSQSGTIPS